MIFEVNIHVHVTKFLRKLIFLVNNALKIITKLNQNYFYCIFTVIDFKK